MPKVQMQSEVLKIRVSASDLEAMRTMAAHDGLTLSEWARRALRRQAGQEAAGGALGAITGIVEAVIRKEIAPVRRLAYVAAFEATVAHNWAHALLGQAMTQRAPVSREQARQVIEREEASARSVAAARTREAHPEREMEPEELLPEVDETFSLDPVDAKLFQEGGE